MKLSTNSIAATVAWTEQPMSYRSLSLNGAQKMSASSLRRIVLHLLGYDHELPEQAQKMRAIEARVLDAIKTT